MISRCQASRGGHLVEQALTLNIDQLIRAGGLRPGWRTSGQLNWTLTSDRSSSVNFEAYLAIPAGYLRLDFVVREETTGSSRHVRQTIAFATTKPRFGGTRWWFICPVTGERVGRLHLPPGATHFASRKAHGLIYSCQSEDIYDRAARHSRKLVARLGADAGPSWPPPLKPKRMRWATYLRYAGQIEACERVADRRWAKVAGRWMARGLL
jgi:hypothetical protein